MSAPFMEYSRRVKIAADGRWQEILQALAGLSDLQVDLKTRKTGAPCPCCGGQDRYSFKNAETGGWACRHCGGGDGWTMLQRINNWEFPQAIRAVGEYLYIDSGEPNKVNQSPIQKGPTKTDFITEQEAIAKAQEHKRKAAYAWHLWTQAKPADPQHPYLQRKQLPPFSLKQHMHPVYGWCLLVPLFNEKGDLMNLEQINPDGLKRPIKGAQRQGCFYQFGQPGFTVYVAEGWSTAAAIHMGKACRPCVLAAMCAGNMDIVAGIARRMFLESNVVIAADHDPAGIKAAIKAASHHNLKIVTPDTAGADFWDSWRKA